MAMLKAGDLDRKIVVLKRVDEQDQDWGTVDTEWLPLTAKPIPAQVRDYLPSRGESLADNVNLAMRPSRIRMRYREDVKSTMRVQFGSRIMEIVTVPAEIGRREGIEFVAQELSTRGSTP